MASEFLFTAVFLRQANFKKKLRIFTFVSVCYFRWTLKFDIIIALCWLLYHMLLTQSSYRQLWSHYSTTKAVNSMTALDLSTTMLNTAYYSAILLLDSILYLTSVFTNLYPVWSQNCWVCLKAPYCTYELMCHFNTCILLSPALDVSRLLCCGFHLFLLTSPYYIN